MQGDSMCQHIRKVGGSMLGEGLGGKDRKLIWRWRSVDFSSSSARGS